MVKILLGYDIIPQNIANAKEKYAQGMYFLSLIRPSGKKNT
jgi:hypothetical protein